MVHHFVICFHVIPSIFSLHAVFSPLLAPLCLWVPVFYLYPTSLLCGHALVLFQSILSMLFLDLCDSVDGYSLSWSRLIAMNGMHLHRYTLVMTAQVYGQQSLPFNQSP